MARVSLCVIARDEEAMLPACLASARPAVDEIVVVDTGSADRTAEVARAAGARVVPHRWDDDFAAARNAALAAATGDWILVMDADERLVDPAGVRAFTAADRAPDAGLLPLVSADRLDRPPAEVARGRGRRGEPVLLPRLFRRTPDLRWHGVVHEHVEPWLRAPGRRIGRVAATLVHYGGIASVVEDRDKIARNIRLLERRIAAEPTDPGPRAYLAAELRRAGRVAEALGHARAAWELARATARPAAGERPISLVPAATELALSALLAGRPDEAARVTAEAIRDSRETPTHPNLHHLHGLAHENAAIHLPPAERPPRLLRARDAFLAATERHGMLFAVPVLPGATSWAAAGRLGMVLVKLGQPEAALACFDAVLRLRPDDATARVGRAEALVLAGRPRRALAELRDRLAAPDADALVVAALAADRLGDRALRDLLRDRALATARDTLRELHRLESLNHLLAAA